MAEAIVSIVVGRLTDLLTEEAQVLNGVRDEIQQLVTEFMRLKTFLRDADSRFDEEKIHSLLADVRDLAYDAEHVVETFLVKASSNGRKRRKHENKCRIKIKDIQRKISIIHDHFADHNIRSTFESSESSDPSRRLKRFYTFTIVEPEIFVGFEADVDRLVGYLVDESDDSYPLISICGMGGLGKTTLAQKIYNHTAIKKYFARRAWVSLSQKWQPKAVLQRILICLVHEKKEEILKMDDDKLVENLLEIQQNKKCLIVLDDIWSNDAWDSIKAAFTAEKSLSKFLLTSRNVYVAEYVNSKGLIHRPESLSPDQSWELLKLKALPTRGGFIDIARDYERMENLGREMVRYCAGLPLAIVILGGILVTKPSLIEWEKVYKDSLSSLKEGKGQEQLFDILVRSYNDLPPQLKPCFLYLGKSMEDKWIDAETLYQLWIAEGIVLSSDKREGETMMQVAESYMGELVHRSMVQVRCNDLESSLTKFKSCSLHDLMRDLSLSRAKAEDFFEAIDLREENDFHLNPSGVSLFANARQLVVYYQDKKAGSYFIKKANHQQHRSILLVNAGGYIRLPPRLGSYLANFKLLRVLDLENLILGRQSVLGAFFVTNIGRVLGSLVYLRYLSLRGSNLENFPWIQKLVLLQTLKLDKIYFELIPPVSGNDLGKLAHLRHLYLPEMFSLYSSCNYKLQFKGLSKLETLENFDTRWCEVKDLPKLSSLRRLKVRARGNYDEVKEMFNLLKFLSSNSCLQYLALHIEIIDRGLVSNPDMIKELWNHKFNLLKFLSSNSCLQYLALHIEIFDRGLVNNPDMIKELWNHKFNLLKFLSSNSCHIFDRALVYNPYLLWNNEFNLQELTIYLDGKLPELSELFEQQQQLNHTHFDVFLICITKLELRLSHLEEDPMPVLEKIPTLRDLVLHYHSYMGKKMVCSAMGFPKLIRLQLWNLPNLEKWRAEEGSMPILQHLRIDSCSKLEELPEGLIFLNSLRQLILSYMPSEFCDRLRFENGEQGPDFYKVAHISDLIIRDFHFNI